MKLPHTNISMQIVQFDKANNSDLLHYIYNFPAQHQLIQLIITIAVFKPLYIESLLIHIKYSRQ